MLTTEIPHSLLHLMAIDMQYESVLVTRQRSNSRGVQISLFHIHILSISTTN